MVEWPATVERGSSTGAVFRERDELLKLGRERELMKKTKMILLFRVIFLVLFAKNLFESLALSLLFLSFFSFLPS